MSDPILRPVDQWSSQEMYIISQNLAGYDKRIIYMKELGNPCQAPSCGIPLSKTKCFRVVGYGDVCDTCHDMYSAMWTSAFFRAAQEEFTKEKERIQKLKERS